MAEKTYQDAFTDELNSFKARVKQRAQARIDEAMKQVEEVRSHMAIERLKLTAHWGHIFKC